MGRLNEFRADAGSELVPFEILISVGKRDHDPDSLGVMAELGVTGLMVAPWTVFPNDRIDTLDGKLMAMDEFAGVFMRDWRRALASVPQLLLGYV